MRIKIKYLTILKLALIIYVFISLGCKTIYFKKEKNDSLLYNCELIDYDITGSCGIHLISGIFLFKNTTSLDSILVIIPYPDEKYFIKGKKYTINCYKEPVNYIPLAKSEKFASYKYPIFYSTIENIKSNYINEKLRYQQIAE